MNRHPALVARMASTLQIASGGRLDPGHRDRRRTEGARGLRHRLPGGPRTGRAARGGRRGHPGAVDRRPGDARLAVLPAARAHTPYPVPDPPPPIIIGGETPAGARLAGRIGDGWTAFDDNFEQNLPLYLEALAAAGRRREDQRVIVGFQGDWLGDESIADSPWVTGAARDLGALAGGRRRRRHRPGPHDRRRRCAGGGHRALVASRSWHHQPRDEPTNRIAGRGARCRTRTDPRLRPVRRAGRARRRAVRAVQPARAARFGQRRRSTGSRSAASSLFVVVLAIVGAGRAVGDRAVPAAVAGVGPRRRRPGGHADRDERGQQRRPDDVPRHRPGGPDREHRRVHAQPADRARARRSRSRSDSPQLGTTVRPLLAECSSP